METELTAGGPAIPLIGDNPYGLAALWAQGDLVARATIVTLVLMSVTTWYILVTKLLDQHLLLRRAKAANAVFWRASSPALGLEALALASPFRAIVATGLRAVEHHEGALVEKIDLHTWVTLSVQRAVGDVIGRLQGGLAILATIGSTAPFVGLFGTVWGIMESFSAIAQAKDTSLTVVAPGIAEALATTAIGLVAAIPASIGYNRIGAAFGGAAQELAGLIEERAVDFVARPEPHAVKEAA